MSDAETAEEDAMSETVPMDSPARHSPLTSDQAAHVARVMSGHKDLLLLKYIAGQREHGGNCFEKPGMLRHGLDEVADLTVYFWTAREQCQAMAKLLRGGGATAADAADFLDRLWTK